MALPLKEQLEQLEAARQIVLGDSALYPQIVQGILPIVGANARLELRRWGANFLAETFASPAFSTIPKEDSAVGVLGTLKDLLELPGEDVEVIKSVVQTVASIYSHVFHYIVTNPHDVPVWNQMASIKSNILKRWDTAAIGVRICAIKFVQKIVQVQTPGMIADPRRPEQNEISLSIVPRDHPMIPPSKLEPEASGLLDRLLNIFQENNRNENGPFASRIKAYVERLTQIRLDIFEEGGRKRGHPSEPTDGLDHNKRRRLGAELPDKEISKVAPLPPGPVSLKQLFTLTDDQDLSNFHVNMLPLDLMMNITLPILARVDQQALNEALNIVRSRLLAVTKSTSNLSQALGDDEEDYEPDFEPREDREQILNKADALPPEDSPYNPIEVALGPFTLPPPPPLTAELTEEIGKGTITRVFDMMGRLDDNAASKKQKSGLNRLAGSYYDKEAWITVVTRLATRASAGLENESDDEEILGAVAITQKSKSGLSNVIRHELWKFVMDDFRARIPVAISWLNEEWYNDRIQKQTAEQAKDGEIRRNPKQHYEQWTLKLLDSIVPYLDAKDKLLIRFLSEIPEVNEEVLKRVKGLARDPERVQLAVNTLLYLVMMKLPARDIAIDALEDLWRNYDDAKAPAAKHLAKWRPQVLASETKPITIPDTNGIKSQGPKGSTPLPFTPDATKVESEQMGNQQAGPPVAAAG